jgi:hypothetical protein
MLAVQNKVLGKPFQDVRTVKAARLAKEVEALEAIASGIPIRCSQSPHEK